MSIIDPTVSWAWIIGLGLLFMPISSFISVLAPIPHTKPNRVRVSLLFTHTQRSEGDQ